MRIIQSITGPVVLGSLLFAGVAVADDERADANVYFMFDSISLDADALRALEEVAIQAEDDPYVTVRLDAFTDSTGTTPYNVGLALRRAVVVREHLERQGIGEDQLVIVAYGEEGPRRGSAAKDRRVAITLTDEPLYSIIDDAMPQAATVLWKEPVTMAEIEGPEDEEIERTSRR